MKLAYLIRVHQAPQQLERLVRRLHTEDTWFVVHFNRRSPDEVYAEAVDRLRDLPRVDWVERWPCYWGGFSLVRATLATIERACRTIDFDHAILLSGQDYPLRSNTEIHAFFEAHRGRSFLEHHALPTPSWGREGGLDRLLLRHFEGVPGFDRPVRIPPSRLPVPEAVRGRFPVRRHFPSGYELYGGSAFWCLSREAIEYVRDFESRHGKIVRFFRNAMFPDEFFFQTILLNSELKDSIVNDDLRFIDWSEGEAHPAVLGARDLDRLLASRKLFARKFDPNRDPRILDLLDEAVG